MYYPQLHNQGSNNMHWTCGLTQRLLAISVSAFVFHVRCGGDGDPFMQLSPCANMFRVTWAGHLSKLVPSSYHKPGRVLPCLQELSAAVTTAAACTGLAGLTQRWLTITVSVVLHVSGGGGGDPPVHCLPCSVDFLCAAGTGP